MAACWKDITALCKEAAAGLDNENPMMHTADFSLYDTMSAIELLDPKMDQCCGVTGSISRNSLLTIHKETPWSMLEVSKTLSALIVYEVAYLEGSIHKYFCCWCRKIHNCVLLLLRTSSLIAILLSSEIISTHYLFAIHFTFSRSELDRECTAM